MELKRTIRNTAGFFLAVILVLLGYLKKNRKIAFQPDTITSIGLHNPPKRLFRKLIAWLKKNGFVFLSSNQLIEILKKKSPCPRGAVWISLDDGWRENLNNVIPIAREYEIPVTIFIYTDAIEDGDFWWRTVQQHPELFPEALREASVIRQQPESVRLQLLEDVKKSGKALNREAMTIEEVREISSVPDITIGAHTVTHPVLPNCRENELEYEIGESKRKLEEWTEENICVFAYPNGLYDVKEREILKKHGYELAVTTEQVFASTGSDSYQFPRFIVMDDGSFIENLCHALGVWEPFIKQFKKNVV